jgi:hypothetical protein
LANGSLKQAQDAVRRTRLLGPTTINRLEDAAKRRTAYQATLRGLFDQVLAEGTAAATATGAAATAALESKKLTVGAILEPRYQEALVARQKAIAVHARAQTEYKREATKDSMETYVKASEALLRATDEVLALQKQIAAGALPERVDARAFADELERRFHTSFVDFRQTLTPTRSRLGPIAAAEEKKETKDDGVDRKDVKIDPDLARRSHGALMTLGKAVGRFGVGNCGELAAVAYRYLVNAKAHNIAYINWDGGNHSFLVVDLDVATLGEVEWAFDAEAPPKSWATSHASVCDPWTQVLPADDIGCFVVTAEKWAARMKGILAEANNHLTPAGTKFQVLGFCANR